MHRRSFFAASVAAVASFFLPVTVGAAPVSGLKAVYRKTASGWQRCRMFELKVGDVMRIVDVPTLDGKGVETLEGVVHSAPQKANGQWEVYITSTPESGT